jgi:hypothetical protein
MPSSSSRPRWQGAVAWIGDRREKPDRLLPQPGRHGRMPTAFDAAARLLAIEADLSREASACSSHCVTCGVERYDFRAYQVLRFGMREAGCPRR